MCSNCALHCATVQLLHILSVGADEIVTMANDMVVRENALIENSYTQIGNVCMKFMLDSSLAGAVAYFMKGKHAKIAYFVGRTAITCRFALLSR